MKIESSDDMKKNGFTLVELATIITILTMVALIATPIIINVIDNSKRKAAERGMESIERAAELYYYNKGTSSGIVFTCANGGCSNGDKVLDLNGTGPESGMVQIDGEGNIFLNSIVISGHLCYKEDGKYICEKTNGTTSDTTTTGSLIVDNSKTNSLSSYKIYGNSTQKTRSGKNLFDIKQVKLNQYVNAGGVSSTANFANKDGCIAFIIAVEPNTTYTLSSSSLLRRRVSEIDSVDTKVIVKDLVTLTGGEMPYTFTTSATTNGLMVTLQTGSNPTGVMTETTVKNANIQLEKGNVATSYEEYGAMPSPEFPSEVKSVGNLVTDSSNPNYGKYEIPIKVTGKNLFDNTKLLATDTTNYDFEVTETGIKQTNLSSKGYYPYTVYDITDIVKPNTKYYFHVDIERNYTSLNSTSNAISGAFRIYVDGKECERIYSTDKIRNKSYTFPATFESVVIKSWTVVAPSSIENFDSNTQYYFEWKNVYIGTEEYTEHEPYREENYSIYLDEPLRKVGNDFDYIDFKSGQLVRNVYGKHLTSDMKWSATWYPIFTTSLESKYEAKHSQSTIVMTKYSVNPYVRITQNEGKVIGFSASDTYWGFADMTSLKTWLDGHPDMVAYYPLKTPIITPLNLPIININKGYSNITIDTEIKPSEFIVDYYK